VPQKAELDFNARLAELRQISYREDFETALYELCMACTIEQCRILRDEVKNQLLWSSKPWRNRADYERSDLTWEQRLRRGVAAWAVRDGNFEDSRDELCSLAWLYHNLALSGVNADARLEEVSERADPRVAKLIRGFIERRPADKSMAAFRLYVEQTPEGPKALFGP
jgi:hypothetical protein